MYITVKTIKRDLGFKGIEISDVIIGFPIIAICILMFSFSSLKIPSIIFLMIGVFMLLPISVSKKNRMYKVIFLMINYCIREKEYIFTTKKLEKERRVNLDELKRKINYQS